MDIIYIDFQKAFDSVAHTELLIKLWTYGITGNLWLWFKSCLMGRFQCISINHQYSVFFFNLFYLECHREVDLCSIYLCE